MTNLLAELNRNLVTANELGNTEWADRLEERIVAEEKKLLPTSPHCHVKELP